MPYMYWSTYYPNKLARYFFVGLLSLRAPHIGPPHVLHGTRTRFISSWVLTQACSHQWWQHVVTEDVRGPLYEYAHYTELAANTTQILNDTFHGTKLSAKHWCFNCWLPLQKSINHSMGKEDDQDGSWALAPSSSMWLMSMYEHH